MMQNSNLNKIANFVQEQIDLTKRSVVIVETASGYKVNDFKIQQVDNSWKVINNKNVIVGQYKNKRLAVLSAALKVKKQFNAIQEATVLDMSLYSLKQDKSFFEYKVVNSVKKALFEDRLGRVLFDLNQTYSRISELEKSVGLQ